jgi:hypothetical protein
MRVLFAILLAISSPIWVFGQSIPRDDQPRFKVEYNPIESKEYLVLTFGVTMSDCIKMVEVRNLDNDRLYYIRPTLDDYFIKEEGSDEIYAKVWVGKLSKVVTQKDGMRAEVTIISKSGKAVFKGRTDFKIERETSDSETESGGTTAIR